MVISCADLIFSVMKLRIQNIKKIALEDDRIKLMEMNMSKLHKEIYICPNCGKEIEYEYWDSVNVTLEPQLKESVLDGSIFNCSCSCGYDENLIHPLLYHDMDKEVMINYTTVDNVEPFINHITKIKNDPNFSLKIDETIRVVTDISAFIEKILIFEAGLDDKIIEFAKSIYRSAYKEVNPSVKDFKIRFSPPDLDAVNELEHDYHFKIINYEDDVYNVIPLDKSKIEKYAEYIDTKEKELKLNSYFIGESWGDAILTGECKSKNGFYSIIDDDRTVQNTKYHQDFDKMKSETKNINKLDSDGYTLLKHAVLADDFNEVKSLLEKGADPNVQMAGKRVVLHYALQNGISTQIIDLLMEYGADINSVASNKLKPLDLIDLRKPVEYLKHMFELGASCDGNSLLRSYAAHSNDVDCIKLLIEKGFSLEARDRNCDFDASCEAICNNNSNQFLEQFLEIGCDPNAKYNGTPCLFSIFDEYYPDLCEEGFYLTRLKLLLQYGADINITDNSKRSAIMIACKKCRRIEIVQFFLLYKPDLTLRDSKGKDVFDYLKENINISEYQKTKIFDLLKTVSSEK